MRMDLFQHLEDGAEQLSLEMKTGVTFLGLEQQPLVLYGGLLQLLGLGLGDEDVAVLVTDLLSAPECDAEQLGLDLGEDVNFLVGLGAGTRSWRWLDDLLGVSVGGGDLLVGLVGAVGFPGGGEAVDHDH